MASHDDRQAGEGMAEDVIENSELHRFELALDDGEAVAYYRSEGDRVVLIHTEVPQQYAGRGIGSRLAKGVFDNLRKTGRKAVVKCSFMAAWASRNPEYNDIIAG
ncbi:MAG TPA: GNAT family N-acetyltransferase [Hyphomicrobiaceae bacterium]